MKYILAFILLLSFNTYAADKHLMDKIIMCESSNRHTNIWGDKGKSYGIVQFQEATFYEFAKEARKGMKAKNLWPPNWYDKSHQLYLLNWGIDNGYGYRWTCYRKIMRGS